MLNTTPTYNLKDISIIPAALSAVKSRSECNPYYKLSDNKKVLPIFASPMAGVVNIENLEVWEHNNIIPIIPRNIPFDIRFKEAKENERWIAVSLKEFQDIFNPEFKLLPAIESFTQILDKRPTLHILIDVANGHMTHIYDMCQSAKRLYKNLFIMVGNIANPDTYEKICEFNYKWRSAGNSSKIIDYVRVGIGSGNCCTTASSTSIFYGMASLIDDCITIRNTQSYLSSSPKIIADGGIRTYNDAITALALGADYVMVGTTFASLFESAAEFQNVELSDELKDILYKYEDEYEEMKINAINECKEPIYKRVYGMSTYVAQKAIDSNAKKRLTEGLGRDVKCYKTIKQWTDEFIGFLRSCMSYCNKKKIVGFVGNVECRVMSPNTANGFNNSIDNFVSKDLYIIKE